MPSGSLPVFSGQTKSFNIYTMNYLASSLLYAKLLSHRRWVSPTLIAVFHREPNIPPSLKVRYPVNSQLLFFKKDS